MLWVVVVVEEEEVRAELFPSVGGLGPRGDHVQEVLSLPGVCGSGALVDRQAGVHVSHGHTWVPAGLLPPGSGVGLVTAAAAAALRALLGGPRAVLTWPVDQRRRRHGVLQLLGGRGEGVADGARAHR